MSSVLANPRFPTYLWNGLKLAVIGAVGAMIFATPAAYALSRFRFRARRFWMIGLLAFQMISPLVIMVPLYRYMDRIGLTESHFGASMIYIAIAAPLFTWMLKGFLDGIPQSLEDAAMIDGCTRFGAFMRVVLPLSLPGLTSAFVLNAILGWSQFIIPFILLSRPNLHADLPSASSISRAPTARRRRSSLPRPACFPSCPRSSSSSCSSASSSARLWPGAVKG